MAHSPGTNCIAMRRRRDFNAVTERLRDKEGNDVRFSPPPKKKKQQQQRSSGVNRDRMDAGKKATRCLPARM